MEVNKINYRSRSSYDQKIVGRENRLSTDHGGHLIATRFRGDKGIKNLIPMNEQVNGSSQVKGVSKGSWYKMENQWNNILNKNPNAKIYGKITQIFRGNSKRAVMYKINYTVKTNSRRKPILKVSKVILNKEGG